MAGNYSDYVYTTAEIAKEWGDGWTADKISKKFGGILKQLDFSEEEREWFRSEASDKQTDDSKTNRNYYIFGSPDAPEKLKMLFDIFEEKGKITGETITDVNDLLFELLPLYRKKTDLNASYKNAQTKELDDLKKLFRQLENLDIVKKAQNKEELSKQYSGILKKQQQKELVQISKMVQKCCEYSILKEEGSNPVMQLNARRQMLNHRFKIEKRVEAYFADKFNPGYLERHIFGGLQKKCNGEIWKEIFSELYIEIEEWHDKWILVMDKALEIIESEAKEEQGSNNLPHRMSLYKKAALKATDTERKTRNRKNSSIYEKDKDLCYRESEKLVNEICGNKNPNESSDSLNDIYKQRLENIKRFKNNYGQAFNYIKIRAFLELNNIRSNIERKQKEYCGMLEAEKKEDNGQTNCPNEPNEVDKFSIQNLFARYS